jgi:hypothetical protein
MDHSVNGAKLQGSNYSLSRELDYKTFRTLRTKTQMAINTVHLLHPTAKKNGCPTMHRHEACNNSHFITGVTVAFSGYKSREKKAEPREGENREAERAVQESLNRGENWGKEKRKEKQKHQERETRTNRKTQEKQRRANREKTREERTEKNTGRQRKKIKKRGKDRHYREGETDTYTKKRQK